MEVREFAERILFGKRIFADKLIVGKNFTDDHPGSPLLTIPRFPEREDCCRLDLWDQTKKHPFPQRHLFSHDNERGKALHFFANHELLALELMALMLLRFPDAPKSFRTTLVSTMEDEQKHLRLYLERMAELGVEFGIIPLNHFFWDCLKSVSSCFEFVINMSLTFEQANLDFSWFYKQEMERAGDLQTAHILKEVFQDEIGHVKQGLHWFRRWKPPHDSEWTSYVAGLKFPLTPARAKGLLFLKDLRTKIGFSEEYIQNLEIFSSSKGRSSNVYTFNPECDFKKDLTSTQKEIRSSLATNLIFMAKSDDILLIEKKPSPDFILKLKQHGFPIPELITSPSELSQRALFSFKPWGLTKEILKQVNLSLFKHLPPLVKEEAPDFQYLLSKSFSYELRKKLVPSLLARYPSANEIIEEDLSLSIKDPSLLTKEETEKIERMRLSQQEDRPLEKDNLPQDTASSMTKNLISNDLCFIIKEHSGCGGIGVKRVKELSDLKKYKGPILIEPYYNRVYDISSLGEILPNNQIIFKGHTRQNIDFYFHYKGSYVGRWTGEEDILKFIPSHNISTLLETLVFLVGEELIKKGYQGHFGIDSFLYKKNGKLFLNPLCEVNARISFGQVALELGKHLRANETGYFGLVKEKKVSAIELKALEESYPLTSSPKHPSLFQKGFLITNELAGTDTHSFFIASRETIESLKETLM